MLLLYWAHSFYGITFAQTTLYLSKREGGKAFWAQSYVSFRSFLAQFPFSIGPSLACIDLEDLPVMVRPPRMIVLLAVSL